MKRKTKRTHHPVRSKNVLVVIKVSAIVVIVGKSQETPNPF